MSSKSFLSKKNFSEVAHLWPILLVRSFIAISVSGVMLNMVQLSAIIWADGAYHALEMGIIISTRTWSMAVSGIIMGYIIDHLPRKILGIILVGIIALGRFLNGFAPVGTQAAYSYFILCYGLVGLGLGGLDPFVVSYTNDSLPVSSRSKFFGISEAVRQISATLGMVTGALLIQLGYWQIYFWGTGILLVAGCLIFMLYLKEPKRGSHSQSQLTEVLENSDIKYDYKLTWATAKSTILAPTNILAFIEGIFTWFIFSIGLFMVFPYLQNPPNNISPVASSFIVIIFGIPGSIVGASVFGSLSDRLGTKDIIWRVNFIIFSILMIAVTIICLFLVPITPIDPAQGNDIIFLFSQYQTYLLGIIVFTMRGVFGIYFVNQNPLIQAINLPEAQGTVSAWGQFLETIANGMGPVVAGVLLASNGGNYMQAAVISMSLGIPGIICWIIARKYIHRDVARVQGILKIRALELKNNHVQNS